MTVVLATLAMFAASLPGSYDCTIGHQTIVTETGGQPEAQARFPEADRDSWRFRLAMPLDAAAVTIDWPANPVQIAGRHLALALAPGQVAFAVPARGPCMFTEQDCLTLVELSARGDGNLDFSILPAGSARNDDGSRSILHVIFTGTCRRREGGA
jgi:hypothetical protein